MSQMHIFVSHSSQDKPFADALVRALRGAGADVWYDEHNLGTGQLLEEIQLEIAARPVFIIILTNAAFASRWVKQEATWAFNLYQREASRIILPVVAAPIEPRDFNAWLFLEDFKRIEGPESRPYPQMQAIERMLHLLALTSEDDVAVPLMLLPKERVEDLIAQGKRLEAQKEYTRAILCFEQAARLAPGSSTVWFNLGFAYGNVQRWEEAADAYERALVINPNDSLTWANKAGALGEIGRHVEAHGACKRALAINPHETLAWVNNAGALLELGRAKEVLIACEHALALDPHDPIIWVNRAAALRGLGREAEAQEAEQRAKELSR